MGEERIRQLMADHHDAVARYVARRLPTDEVGEVVAEVFVIAWQRLDTLDGQRELPWLYGVARNKIAHRRRAHARWTRLVDRLGNLSTDAAIGDPADGVASDDLIARAADRLSTDERELLQLISWERLTTDELAVVLGCTANTVHQRIHRLRKNLRVHVAAIDQSDTHTTTRGTSHD